MNDYDFGKYYKNKQNFASRNIADSGLQKLYRKLSIGLIAGLVIFFAGLMTGIHFQKNKITGKTSVAETENSEVINTADISPNAMPNMPNTLQKEAPKAEDTDKETPAENADNTFEKSASQNLKKTLMNPANEYIILARRYNDTSKDRALYYAGVLNKITRDYNYEVIPSIRGKNIKLYVGPMKGKANAEKMLARVKSIPEFANSAILYKK